MSEVPENAAKFQYGMKWYLHTVLTQYDRSARETHNIHSNAPIVQIYSRCVPWTVVCMRNANRRHLPLRKTVAMHAHTHTHRTAYRCEGDEFWSGKIPRQIRADEIDDELTRGLATLKEFMVTSSRFKLMKYLCNQVCTWRYKQFGYTE